MKSYITEDDIEQALLKKLKAAPFDYDIILCDPNLEAKDDLNDGTNRDSVTQCVLPDILKTSLKRINPTIEENLIQKTIKELSQNFSGTDNVQTNYTLYQKIRDSIKIPIKKNGKEDFDYIKLVDFENPKNNAFTAVS